MTENITYEIKEQIAQISYYRNGEWYISLGNCRLDFSKEYKIIKFTKKTVKLAWQNGGEWIPVNAQVEDRGDYFALYTEGWSFCEHLHKNKEVVVQ